MTDENGVEVPVVLHFRGGETRHCTTSPAIEHRTETVKTGADCGGEEVPFSALKAVFFLAREGADIEPTPEGSTLVVEFADGEVIRGITRGYNPEKNGFILYPVDRSKNDKIFVVNSAIVSIDVEKL